MTPESVAPSEAPEPRLLPGVRLIHVPPELLLAAAERLVGDQSPDPHHAAERFLDNAGTVGIDLGLMWATVSGERPISVRQVVLAVVGAGHTAMLFISGPERRGVGAIRRSPPRAEPPWGPMVALSEREALLRTACRRVAEGFGGKPAARMAQALLESHEKDALQAFLAAGFTRVGDLAYLRRSERQPPPWSPLPTGARLRTVGDLLSEGRSIGDVDAMVSSVLERTYIDTKDCPELCGLRAPTEVLASHRAVGRYDPDLWWIVFDEARPVGCMLFNIVPEQEGVELVYLGLAPEVRGRGLGAGVLARGLRHLLGWADAQAERATGDRKRVLVGTGGVMCAVDTRNAAALRLYRSLGFQRFAARIPMVKGLELPPSDTA
ncbi:MAG: GNAT family N-acetyltransferase [Phycisphaerales bacterium]